jgi:hypothetical protein
MQLQIPAIPTLVSFIWLCCMLAVAYKVKYGNRRDLVNCSFVLLFLFEIYITHSYDETRYESYAHILFSIFSIYVLYHLSPKKQLIKQI